MIQEPVHYNIERSLVRKLFPAAVLLTLLTILSFGAEQVEAYYSRNGQIKMANRIQPEFTIKLVNLKGSKND